MAASWTLVLCDEQGVEIAELSEAFGVKYAARRNLAAQMDLSLDLEDDAAAQLVGVLRTNGLPRLKAWRNGSLRFYGWWAPSRLASTSDGGSGQFIFRDPFDRYEHRHRSAYEFAATDAGDMAKQMIEIYDTDPRPYGLDVGTIEATVIRDRTYEAGKFTGEAIRQLTQVAGGFDFTVTPRDDLGPNVLGVFDVHAALGSDRSETVIFEHGPETLSNVLSVAQEIGYPINYATANGTDGVASVSAIDTTSGGRYGYFTKPVQPTDGTTQTATLQALCDAAIHGDLVSVVSFEPDPELAPQPWDDYWTGDTVRLRSDYGALSLDATPRINGFDITLDDDGNEASHNLIIEEAT